MAFRGFDDRSLEYFWGASLNNSKQYYEDNKLLYQSAVKEPLTELHAALCPSALTIDADICTLPRRCISKVYNDFRYSGKRYPIKDYMFLHFCANVADEQGDTPGLFFGAGLRGWDCGFTVYHVTNAGMRRFKDAIKAHHKQFTAIAEKIKNDRRITVGGDAYKKDHYPDEPESVKVFLNRKSLWVAAHYPHDDYYRTPELIDEIGSVWQTLAPLYRFYLDALKRDGE